MKNITHIVILSFALAACGSSDGGGGDSAPETNPEETSNETPSPLMTKLVQPGELQPCTPENETQLVYVDTIGFKHCKAGSWVDLNIKGEKGDQGETGENGAGFDFKRQMMIDPDDTELCTFDPETSCKFIGGTANEMSDGRIMFQGVFVVIGQEDEGAGEIDDVVLSRTTPLQVCDPVKDQACSISTVGIAAFGNADIRQLFLVYSSLSDDFTLWYDDNNNGKYDSNDVIFVTLDKTVL